MIGFIIAAAIVVVLSLSLLLWPLLRVGKVAEGIRADELSVRVLREQLADLEGERSLLDASVYAEEQAELRRRALEDGRAAVASAAPATPRRFQLAAVLVLAVPALALGFYAMLGTPEAMRPQHQMNAGDHAVSPQQMEQLVAGLAERMKTTPDDAQGWMMLGRSYTAMGRFDDAAAAFKRLTQLVPDNADVLADYADALAMANGRVLAGEPEQVVAQALKIDPKHVKSLAIAGSAAFERGDYAKAVSDWQQILEQLPPDAPMVDNINSSIAEARQLAGGTLAAAKPAEKTTPQAGKTAAPGAKPLVGEVRIAPELAAKLPANATLYVFARPATGGRMPLAMKRIDAARLPVPFALDDSMSMTPEAKLSAAKSVIVGARVALAGDAIGKPGDLEGFSAAVSSSAQGVIVTINSVRP